MNPLRWRERQACVGRLRNGAPSWALCFFAGAMPSWCERAAVSLQTLRGSHWLLIVGCLCMPFSVAIAASGTPLQLKPSGSVDAWQIALKAMIIGALGIAAVVGALYVWRNRKALPPLTAGEERVSVLDWAKRLQGLQRRSTADNRAAAVEWARRISPRTTLVQVRWEGRRYLLSENGSQTMLIDSRAVGESAA